ncbi:MAG TPA: 4'-phosphopantetheinyl transferase superfamily protein [Verrucomicrobiae bacterium]|nr:4'-phosphopantetheinyl transferase superfamily protein [Verrucomicrobiae bacterium]
MVETLKSQKREHLRAEEPGDEVFRAEFTPRAAPNWPAPPPAWRLDMQAGIAAAPRVHVWAVALDAPEHTRALLSRSLSPDERERAGRYRFATHRNRFTVSRGTLRNILGCYLGESPEQISFAYGEHGKPGLELRQARSGIRFNLADCDDLALIAVCQGAEAGVDVERVRTIPEVGELVSRFFSRRESAAFAALPEWQKPDAFFRLWTRKEAWLKATGQGIAQHLARVEVSFLPGEPAQLLGVPREISAGRQWSVSHLEPRAGWVGALALAGSLTHPCCWTWNQTTEENLS